MKYTTNLLKGFGTSSHIQGMHYRAALRVNAALETHSALIADRTRTKSEKAPMLSQLQKKLTTEAARDLRGILDNINARLDDFNARGEKLKASMSMSDALILVTAVKGLDAGKVVSAARESRELALAMHIAPSAITGFDKENTFMALLNNHYPDLKTEYDEIKADFSAYESLSNNVANTTREIGYDVDLKALDSRFDENNLEVSPEPKTMAEQNAELARLERASGVEPSADE